MEEINQRADASVDVVYDPNEGVIFIDGKEIRPSEILYHFDRETYAVKIQAAKEQKRKEASEARADAIRETIEQLVYDLLMEDWYTDYKRLSPDR